MKIFIAILVSFFAATSFADVEPVSKTYSFVPAQETKVLQLNLKTSFAVNCPGTLNLKHSVYNGVIKVDYNNNVNEAIMSLAKRVSSECGEEIFEDLTGPKFVCLSIGFEYGMVFLPVPHMPEDKESFEIQIPAFLELTDVVELK